MRSARWLSLFLLVMGCGVAVEPAPDTTRQTLALSGFNGSEPFDCTTDTPWMPRPGDPEPSPSGLPSAMPSGVPSPPETCGLVINFTQGGWGSRPRGDNPGQFLETNWAELVSGGVLTVGIGHTLTFTSAEAVSAFLPSGGTAGPLSASSENPDQPTEAGVLAGQVTALKLNLLASAFRATADSVPLADLHLMSGPFAGDTVEAFLIKAERLLGGDTSVLAAGQTVSDVNDTAAQLNEYSHEGREPDGEFLACPGGCVLRNAGE